MTPADIVAVAAFFSIVVAGMLLSTLRDVARRRPGPRIQERMQHIRQLRIVNQRVATPVENVELFSRPKNYGTLTAWFAERVQRVKTVSGTGGLRLIGLGAFAAAAIAAIVVAFAPTPGWSRPLILIGAPVLVVRMSYRFLIEQFRARFLAVFPDTLDLIIRAVRAGIPVVQAISIAGQETQEPVRSTFRTMGDSLLLGADLKDVLDRATEELQIADFSFFSVCLMLQRETGGSLGETLENLSGIIRTRRDIRIKTRALTAEGRIASKFISAVPFAITGLLFLVNRPYIELLFNTRAGHKMLTLAAVLLVIGLAMIRKISNLDTSR
ncbi:type II secretion system protein [Pandoraea terrae]|uniref:Type II secretion system protein n=1 Tax=Pandoraea terrae TaxID=1537710 RepID=A0A5E4SQ98_9BURK|nr:type II secretion system F family protein [Pandoraea terrae]VVD76514.1 type II secretion system protein [Pandoraea terrae]